MRILFPERDALPRAHYLRAKSFGWTSWCATFKEALIAAGAEVVPSPPRSGYVVEFEEDGKSCRALIDYSSHATPFNLYDPKLRDQYLELNCREPYDFILSLKYDSRHLDLYALFGIVEPAGYIAFNTQARAEADRWGKVSVWRELFDSQTKAVKLFARMGTVNSKPGRSTTAWGGVPRDRQLKRLQELGVPLDGPGPKVPWSEYMKLMRSSMAGLNLPGWGDSICYRTLEYACVGLPMISGPELESMILPWGRKWEHEVNHLRVRSMDEVSKAFARLCSDRDLYLQLVRGSRDLFDAVFTPEPTGRWWIETARKYLK